jgi:ankyrin repeat protein
MQDYDKTRWVELLKHGSLDDIRQELAKHPKQLLLNLTDSSTSRQTCIFHTIQDTNERHGDQVLEMLLKEGADPCHKDVLNQTAVFYTARFGHDRQLQMLLNAGASANDKDTYGQTPLYYAAREGFTSIVRKLIAAGADVNAVDNLGQTALFYSAREGRVESSRYIVEHGANVNQCDRTQQTPLSWARKSGNTELVQYLISKGAEDKVARRKKDDPPKPTPESLKRKPERKVRCQLMLVDDSGNKRPVSPEELSEFETKYPDIAKYWKDPASLEELEQIDLETLESLKPWEKPGKKLMNLLWRANNAWIFHEPVDPVKLGIPDYLDVIKHPMDFGTIKRKLGNNVYRSGEEFIADLELVFRNCRKYNQPGTDVHAICETVSDVYLTQRKALGLDKYAEE